MFINGRGVVYTKHLMGMEWRLWVPALGGIQELDVALTELQDGILGNLSIT